jgi:glyoxylase-like metal-dependent hydrolase (beta-lactamase superfamily II)
VLPTPDGLDLLGIDPATVDMVITSHFLYDHIGFLKLFTGAQVVSGQAEYDYWFGKWENDDLDGEFAIAEHLEVVRRAQDEGRLRRRQRARHPRGDLGRPDPRRGARQPRPLRLVPSPCPAPPRPAPPGHGGRLTAVRSRRSGHGGQVTAVRSRRSGHGGQGW